MRVLLVEDDPVTATMMRTMFEREDAKVEETSTAEEAMEFAKLYQFDLLIVDLGLPDLGGCALVKRIRSADINTPILIVSASDDPEEKLEAFFSGADDYLTKPFDPRELLARQRAIVRRASGYSGSEIRIGRLSIDMNARSVCVDNQRLPVTAKEYSILELLALRKGTTLTKETFLDHLYGGMDEPEQKIIDVFVCKLRKKIAAISKDDPIIQTVWGHGYVLNDTNAQQGVAEDPSNFVYKESTNDRETEVEALLLSLWEPAGRA